MERLNTRKNAPAWPKRLLLFHCDVIFSEYSKLHFYSVKVFGCQFAYLVVHVFLSIDRDLAIRHKEKKKKPVESTLRVNVMFVALYYLLLVQMCHYLNLLFQLQFSFTIMKTYINC